MMKFVGNGKVETYEKVEDVPYEITGNTGDLSEARARGCLVHRAELDNQPQFKGWCGPMWDGNMLRYETWKVYDMLSR